MSLLILVLFFGFMFTAFIMCLRWLLMPKGGNIRNDPKKIEEFSADMRECQRRILKVADDVSKIPPLEVIQAKQIEGKDKNFFDKFKSKRKQSPNSSATPVIKGMRRKRPESTPTIEPSSQLTDLVDALKALGYKEKDCMQAAQQTISSNDSKDVSILLRSALALL